jgi:hypothetical protein
VAERLIFAPPSMRTERPVPPVQIMAAVRLIGPVLAVVLTVKASFDGGDASPPSVIVPLSEKEKPVTVNAPPPVLTVSPIVTPSVPERAMLPPVVVIVPRVVVLVAPVVNSELIVAVRFPPPVATGVSIVTVPVFVMVIAPVDVSDPDPPVVKFVIPPMAIVPVLTIGPLIDTVPFDTAAPPGIAVAVLIVIDEAAMIVGAGVALGFPTEKFPPALTNGPVVLIIPLTATAPPFSVV